MAEKLSKQELQRLREKEQFERDRKKWQQQESRKRVKKSGRKDRGPALFKAVAIVLAAAVVLGLGSIYAGSYGVPGRYLTALTVGTQNIGAPVWAYNFYTVYRQIHQFGSLYGMNVNASAFGQTSPNTRDETEDGPKITWDEFIRRQVNTSLQSEYALYSEARKAGFELDEEAQKSLETSMAELKATATGSAMSVGAYLRHSYLAGLTEKKYRLVQERLMVAQGFSAQKQEEFRDNHTEEALQAEYDKDPGAYNQVDYRIYTFPKAEGADAKQKAEDFLAAAATEEAFIAAAQAAYDAQHDHGDEEADHAHDYDADATTLSLRRKKADIAGTYGDEGFAAWFFAAGRKAGDSTVWETDSSVYAAHLVRPAYAQTTVDFYTVEVVIGQDEEESGEGAPTATEKAKQEADRLLATWKKNGGTKEAFAALQGKPELTEKAAPGAFTDLDSWLFDPVRKAGEATVIEGAAGYKVVYLASQNADDFVWKTEIAVTFVNEDFDAYVEGLQEQYPFGYHGFGMRYALKEAQRMCDAWMEYAAEQGLNYNYADYLQ